MSDACAHASRPLRSPRDGRDPARRGEAGPAGRPDPGRATASAGYGQPGYGQPGYGRPGGWNAAPAPGGIPLRPLGLGDILNGAVTSARRNPAATFGLAAIVMTAYGILTAIIEAAERSRSGRLTSLQHTVQNGQNLSPHQVDSAVTSVLGVLLPAFALTIVLSLVMTSALTGMLSVVIGRGILGRTVSLGEAWRACRLGAVIGTSLLLLLIAVGVPLPVAVVAVVLVLLHLGPVAAIIAVLGGIASVVFEILLGIRLSLTLPALMLERTTPRNAIARSWELSRGSFWRLFGILLLTEIVVGIAATLLSLPFTILGNLAGGDSSNLFSLAASASVAAVILGAIGGIVASTIARPVSAGVAVLLYADLRMRREGLDLALRSAAGSQALTGDEFATAWPPAAGPGSQPSGLVGVASARGSPRSWRLRRPVQGRRGCGLRGVACFAIRGALGRQAACQYGARVSDTSR